MKLFAGAAMRSITPDEETLRLLRESGKIFDGIGHELYMRAVVLTDGEKPRLVILASDLSTFPMSDKLVKHLEETYGLGPEAILCGGTRSHNTIHVPVTGPYEEMKPGFREYARLTDETAMALVREAVEKAEPARIGGAVGVSGINVSREYPCPLGTIESQNHAEPAAHRLRVARLEAMDGRTIAVIVNYSMHCCLMCWNDFIGDYKMVDGDVGGAVSRYVERAGRYTYPVLWTVGGGTDRQPTIYSRLERCEVDEEGNFYQVREVLPAEGGLMLLRQYAAEQGQDVLRTIRGIDNYVDEVELRPEMTEKTLPARESMMRQVERQMKWTFDRDVFYQPGMDMTPQPSGKDLTLRCRLAAAGPVAFAGVNASPYAKNYEALADALPYDVTILFDDCFGSVTSIPVPEAEEQGVWAHSTLQNNCLTARIATEAFLGAFHELKQRMEKES